MQFRWLPFYTILLQYISYFKKKDERFPIIYKIGPSSDANSEFALKETALEHDGRLHICVT